MNSCPLCQSSKIEFYFEDKQRSYQQCGNCALVFVPSEFFLTPQKEKAIYDLHENSLNDQSYINFLNRLAKPLVEELKAQSSGLDFGCGPAPVLAKSLENYGHKVALYDKFYATDAGVLDTEYDFITCTETIEHFHTPATEWQLLLSILKPGGVLGLMTKLVINKERFASWHYKNDLTHVSFFSKETFDFLAKRDNLDLNYVGNDVIMLKKR